MLAVHINAITYFKAYMYMQTKNGLKSAQYQLTTRRKFKLNHGRWFKGFNAHLSLTKFINTILLQNGDGQIWPKSWQALSVVNKFFH